MAAVEVVYLSPPPIRVHEAVSRLGWAWLEASTLIDGRWHRIEATGIDEGHARDELEDAARRLEALVRAVARGRSRT